MFHFQSKINGIYQYFFLAICRALELQPSASDSAYNIYYYEKSFIKSAYISSANFQKLPNYYNIDLPNLPT